MLGFEDADSGKFIETIGMNTPAPSLLETLAKDQNVHSLRCPSCGKHIESVEGGGCPLCSTKLHVGVNIPKGLRLKVFLLGLPMAYSFLSALILALPMGLATTLPHEAIAAEICGALSGVGLFVAWCLRYRFLQARSAIQFAWLGGIWLGYFVFAIIVFVVL